MSRPPVSSGLQPFRPGFSHKAGAVRIFKVTRVLSAALTAEPFDRPPGFSLESHFRNTFGIVRSGGKPVEVVVRFASRALRPVPATAIDVSELHATHVKPTRR